MSQNLFAYSYYSGAEKKTKMSLVRLHPSTHQMTAVGEPTVAWNDLFGLCWVILLMEEIRAFSR